MEPEPAPDHETPPVQGAPSAAGGEGPDHTLVSVHRVVFPAPAGTGCLGGLIIVIIELSLVDAFNKEEAPVSLDSNYCEKAKFRRQLHLITSRNGIAEHVTAVPSTLRTLHRTRRGDRR